jgi:hypothetical protein
MRKGLWKHMHPTRQTSRIGKSAPSTLFRVLDTTLFAETSLVCSSGDRTTRMCQNVAIMANPNADDTTATHMISVDLNDLSIIGRGALKDAVTVRGHGSDVRI